MPVAPNVSAQIRAVFAAHPEIDTRTDGVRGQITTLVVQALGGLPWGRKEKVKGSGILSDDALCYRLPDGRFEIYDIIAGGSGAPGFDFAGTFANGENGYFYEVAGSTSGGGGGTGGGTGGGGSVDIPALVKAEVAKALATALQRITIRSSRGHYLRDDWNGDLARFDRTEAQEGETYRLEIKS